MGECKGNVGHLMQHWTLCELLDVAQRNHIPGLSFIDAHAMASCSRIPIKMDKKFSSARAGLPGQQSVYELAWHHLAPLEGYPNSAAFVHRVWRRDLSMLLCEIDPATIKEIEAWLVGVRYSPRCRVAEPFEGDWRDRFNEAIVRTSDVWSSDEVLTLVSFDPIVCGWRRGVRRRKGKNSNEGNLYPEHIEQALYAMSRLEGGILIQMSTYSAQNNRQGDVISSVDSILAARKFTRSAVVRPHGSMMSLVYARNVPWSDELDSLPDRFTAWLHEF